MGGRRTEIGVHDPRFGNIRPKYERDVPKLRIMA